MRTVVVACVITACAFIGHSAWADLFDPADIDQQQTSIDLCYAVGDLLGMPVSTMMAQTFTVGKPGIWYGIEIGVIDAPIYGPVSPPLVQIGYTQEDGLPPWTNLGSVTLSDPDPSDGWIRGTLVSPISVTAGEMYSIIVQRDPESPGIVSVGATYNESYRPDPLNLNPLDPDGGALWGNDDGTNWELLMLSGDGLFDFPVYDMQFRTYVAPVPLPAGVLLGILGLGVAGWRLRRQMA